MLYDFSISLQLKLFSSDSNEIHFFEDEFYWYFVSKFGITLYEKERILS